jgi:hypothetical protein
MLIKTGDAEIVGIVDPKRIEDDETRKKTLSNVLNEAKEYVSSSKDNNSKDKKTEN